MCSTQNLLTITFLMAFNPARGLMLWGIPERQIIKLNNFCTERQRRGVDKNIFI